jgi:hypothetical protein
MKDKRLTIRLPNNHPIWQEKPGERSRIVKEALRLYYDLHGYLKEIAIQYTHQQNEADAASELNEPAQKKDKEIVDSRLFSEDFVEKMLKF